MVIIDRLQLKTEIYRLQVITVFQYLNFLYSHYLACVIESIIDKVIYFLQKGNTKKPEQRNESHHFQKPSDTGS